MTDKDERRKQRNRLSAKKSYWSKKHERRQLEKTHEKEERRQIVLNDEVTKLRQYAQRLEQVIQTADHSQQCRLIPPHVPETRTAGLRQSACHRSSASTSTGGGQNTFAAWEQTEYNCQSTNSDVRCFIAPSSTLTTASELGLNGSFTPSTKSNLSCALNAPPRSDFDIGQGGYTEYARKANVHFESQTGQSSSAKDNAEFLGLPVFLLDQDSASLKPPFVEKVKDAKKRIDLNVATQNEISEGFQTDGNTLDHFWALLEVGGQQKSSTAMCTRSGECCQENTITTVDSLENTAGRTGSVSSHESATAATPFLNIGAFPSQPLQKRSVQSTDDFLTPTDVSINTPSSLHTRSVTCSRSRKVTSVDPFTMDASRSIAVTAPRTTPTGPEFSHQADMFTHERPRPKPDKPSVCSLTPTTTQLEPRIGWKKQTSAKSADIAQNAFGLIQEKSTSLRAREASTLPAAMPNGAPALISSHTGYLPGSALQVRSESSEVTSVTVSLSLSDFLSPHTLSEDSGCAAIDHLLSDGKLSRLFEIVESMDSQDLQGPALVIEEKETASYWKDPRLSCADSDRNLSNKPGSHFDGHCFQDIHHTSQNVGVRTAANITANSSSLVKASDRFQIPETLGRECGNASVTLQDVNIRLKVNYT